MKNCKVTKNYPCEIVKQERSSSDYGNLSENFLTLSLAFTIPVLKGGLTPSFLLCLFINCSYGTTDTFVRM